MTRYSGQVTVPRFLVGVTLAGVGIAVLVGFSHVLVPPGEILPELPAPAEEDGPAPGAIVCPPAGDLPPPEVPVEVDASTLIDCPQLFDRRRVVFTGEAIHVVLPRNGRAWLHVNDDLYSGAAGPLPQHRTALGGNSGIAVSVPLSSARRIRHLGSHRAQGDRLRIVGAFRAADPADGGAPTIQADEATVVEPGHEIRQPISRRRLAVAISLVFLTGGAVLAHRRWPAEDRA